VRPDRGKIAAEQAVRSPLLEDVNLAGARGVLVNVTASAGLKMKEYYDVMNTIKEFTADDAMVIVGTVIDDAIGDDLRVTMIATGLAARPPLRRSRRSSRCSRRRPWSTARHRRPRRSRRDHRLRAPRCSPP
jgi:cell division protein FtsZ